MKPEFSVQTALDHLAAQGFHCDSGNLEENYAFIWLCEHAVELDGLLWKNQTQWTLPDNF